MEYQFSREALPPAKSAPPPPTHTITPAHVNSTFAFLVHDQESMLKHTPPNVDNKPLVRQKRRRTKYVAFRALHASWSPQAVSYVATLLAVLDASDSAEANVLLVTKIKKSSRPSSHETQDPTAQHATA